MNPVIAPISSATAAIAADRREQLAEAAKQFEAIFVRQMLAAARKTQFGGNELTGGQGMDTFRQMQDERFADIAAERGSFGLAKMIEAQLAVRAAENPPRHGEVARAKRVTEGAHISSSAALSGEVGPLHHPADGPPPRSGEDFQSSDRGS